MFSGVGVPGGAVLCWLEKLRIFLRCITLSVRLAVNISLGQVIFTLMGGLVEIYNFTWNFSVGNYFWIFLLMMVGMGFLLVEMAVGFIQAYLFCLLLRTYRREHSI